MVVSGSPSPDAPESGPATVPGLTVAAVARRLGVAPATLRTWDRRYGLGPTERSAGSHRRYSATDVARLDYMRRLVNTGVPPADAARAALAADVAPAAAVPGPTGLVPPPTEAVDADIDPLFADVAPSGAGAGGGNVIPLPDGSPAVRGLARAAMSLDPIACGEIVRETLERRGVVWTWDELVVPVLVGIGRRWEQTGTGVEVEHLLSESVTSALTGVTTRLRAPINPRPVLLACAPEEMHSLPLFALAAALAERRIGARVLGARMPHDALVAAVRRTGPSAVLLWSAYPTSDGGAQALQELPTMRPAPVVLTGGPGWTEPAPPGVAHVHDLTGAVATIARAVGV
jgi:DNA-binding transcriptional MerR regulator